MDRLSGKTALVVGGASGIGLAIAERFAAEGAHVTLTGRRRETVDAAVARIGAVRGVVADASVPAQIAAVVDRLETGVDVLVVSAGVSEYAPLEAITPDHLARTFDLNVHALILAVQAAAARMGEGGAIVLVGSIAGLIGAPGRGAYSASKAAVRSLARTFAAELAPRGIRINVVSPGPIDTAMMAAVAEAEKRALTSLIPLGRMGRAEEVAAAALFLASDEASYVSGAELCVDGALAQV